MAKNVCDVLGQGNSRQALSFLDDNEKSTVTIDDGICGNPNMAVIKESDLYSLIPRSVEVPPAPLWVPSAMGGYDGSFPLGLGRTPVMLYPVTNLGIVQNYFVKWRGWRAWRVKTKIVKVFLSEFAP
ncbi:MAG: hypothetical protein JXR25_17020 [Pontiellaceae bacterium]|nr:hypothetical protein [Pontiellaceae bacterium]MBN2786524.1 hypothetical protein [Pontiellaceae bacterium]